MKRFLLCALAALALCLCCLLPVSAAADTFIYDQSGVLNMGTQEAQALEQRAAELSRKYNCGIYTVLVPRYNVYGSSIQQAAEAIFRDNDFGLGEDKSGILLLICTLDRKYDLDAHGYGNVAFTDYGKTVLADRFVDNLERDDWFGGVQAYIEYCDTMLDRAAQGRPIDIGDRTIAQKIGPIGVALAVVVLPCFIALVVCTNLKRKMKSVARAVNAREYVVPNSLNLYESSDTFSHITETRIKVESDSRSGRGGGTSVNSGGHSHSSGSF